MKTPLLLLIFCCVLHSSSYASSKLPQSFPTWETLQNSNKPPQKVDKIYWQYQLHYLNLSDALALLKQSRGVAVSKTGKIFHLKNQSQLRFYDFKPYKKSCIQLLKSFDRPTPQVLIQAKIVSIDKQSLAALGLQFDSGNSRPQHSRQQNSATIPIAFWHNEQSLNITLSALEAKGQARILSEPRLLTHLYQSARIEAGDEIPYQQANGFGTTSITFKKAVLKLAVTPLWQSGRRLRLKIDVHQDQVAKFQVQGIPAIHTQHIQTQSTCLSGKTLVLGGIYTQQTEQHQNGIPLLQSLPLLGKIFQYRRHESRTRELLIFITPRLTRGYH